jgi:hypothetical protein
VKGFPRSRTRQLGAALILLAAILLLGLSWALVSALGAATSDAAGQRAHNARVLSEAKTALIGWLAVNALDATENNPGRLPCPQAWGDVGSVNEGRAAGNCSGTAVGWLPWRTLGLPKLLDASGQQLWYVVSPGWHLPSAGATLLLNSNTPGQLALDGNAAVALIIAPGAALNVAPNANQASVGCAARSQAQALSLPGTLPNPLDFLECQNGTTTDNVFTASVVDNGINPVFNDHVLAITTAEVMPALEAAISRRIELEIAPVLKTVYGDAMWGTTPTNPAFAFPAPFGDPTTSSYQGQPGCSLASPALCQGLLPFNYHSSSCAADPRCSSDTIIWGAPSLSSSGGPGYLPSAPNCYVSGSTPICEGYYYGGTLNIAMSNAAADITKGLRTFTAANHTAVAWWWNWDGFSWGGPYALGATPSRSLASSGAANFIASASLPTVSTWGYYYIEQSRPALSDHPILSATAANTGWFVRNEWYRLLYYAIAAGHAPGGSLSCSDSGTITCLQVSNLADPAKQQAVLALAGRALSPLTQTRPSPNLQNYLDSTENLNGDSIFVQSTVNRSFNDRFSSLSKKP